MNDFEARELLTYSRVARLATVRPDGKPHVVPITFALVGETIVTMIDHKPKTTSRLQRLVNIEANSSVSILVDEWSESWERLRWARVDGTVQIHVEDEVWRKSQEALVAKYAQYSDRPPRGVAIAVSIDRVTAWASSG